MKKYIEIQKEVLKDLNIESKVLDIDIKNSIQSCYNTFYHALYYKYNNYSIAKDLSNELMKKYELYLIK